MSVKRVSYLGLFLSVSLVISYIEAILPPFIGIPGVKPGFSNIVTLITLKLFGKREAFLVLTARILLSGLLFGNGFSFVFSLSGGLLAMAVMSAAVSFKSLSLIGVSMLGGVFHNLGQLVMAAVLIKQLKIAYYGPVLLVSGLIAGALTGCTAALLIPRLEGLIRESEDPLKKN
jgi:heptaprenyl diphosphate synthase